MRQYVHTVHASVLRTWYDAECMELNICQIKVNHHCIASSM